MPAHRHCNILAAYLSEQTCLCVWGQDGDGPGQEEGQAPTYLFGLAHLLRKGTTWLKSSCFLITL